jgi:hypothetical protein
MFTPKHEILLEQYIEPLEGNIHIVTQNIKRETIASHIVKAETATPLTQGIPLDVIGWFSSKFSGGYMGWREVRPRRSSRHGS